MTAEPSSPYRNVESLCEAIERGERLEYVLFWGHTPAKPGALGKECLSQWYPAPFEADGERFPTAEHYMMYRKARLFGDQQIAERALQVASPGEVKALGRAVRGFDDAVWEEQRFAIVVEGSLAK